MPLSGSTIRYKMRARAPFWRRQGLSFTVLLACLGLCSPESAAGKVSRPHKVSRRAESKEIEGLEQQWRDALLHSDTATLDRMLADDFISISSNGTLSDKQQYLQRLGSHVNTFASLDLVDLKVRVRPGSAVAISQTRLTGLIEGHAVNGTFRNTRVYGRSPNGQWRILNSEATRISGLTSNTGDMEGGTPLRMPSAVSP